VTEKPFVLDRVSLLVSAPGDARIADLEHFLEGEGLTLDLSPLPDATVAAWLGHGAKGSRSPWLDPVDHLVAGFEATLKDGRRLEVRPAPRRAVGPDMLSLFFGTEDRFGSFTRAWLRVHRKDVVRPTTAPFEAKDPPLERGEHALWDALEKELSSRS
jgi:alkyldihydroxyacetonephosphate synthase